MTDWDPRDNIDQVETIGSNKFDVRYFKGLPGCWRKDNGEYLAYRDDVIETWSVVLPPQYDEWEIASADDPEEAVADLQKFIAEAQDALDCLRRFAAGPTR